MSSPVVISSKLPELRLKRNSPLDISKQLISLSHAMLMFNRPGVAGAVLQTPSSLIH